MSVPTDQVSGPTLLAQIPLRGMRRTIARRMTESLQSSAQLTLHTICGAAGLFSTFGAMKELQPLGSISLNDLLLFAVARTLPEHPALNATLEDDVISRWTSVNLGFAVALEDGLIVPVIRECQERELHDLASAAHGLAEKSRTGALTMTDVTDGTFTVTNLGGFGIDHFTPIINPPQVGILGIGRATPQGLPLSLTIDHRALDGVVGARFLSGLSETIGAMHLAAERVEWS